MAIELEPRRIKHYARPVRLGAEHQIQANEMISEEAAVKQRPKMILTTRSARGGHRMLLLALVALSQLVWGRCDTAASSSTPAPSRSSQKASGGGGGGGSSSKESLLSSLAQSVELQHFKAKQPARLSKFDASAQDNSYLDLGAPAGGKSKRLGYGGHQEPDGMSQILRMHESANLKPAANNNPQQQAPTGGSSVQERLKRWRQVSPPRLIKPNKMVAQVLSYITPLMGSKLSTLKLHPFAGRSLVDFGDELAVPAKAPPRAKSSKSYTSEPTTLIEQTTARKRSTGYSLNADDEIKDLMADSSSLSSLISPLSSMLMASEEPNPNQDQQRPPPVTIEASKQTEESETTSPTRVDAKKTGNGSNQAGRRPSRASTWLKQGANHVAQNYFQNSFRDLITLSQLPILSASTISTAPSVLEKKQSQTTQGELAGGDKNKRNKKNRSPTDEFRRRALEELYRYAYILATGVRNKKDPLTALASKPGSLTSALANYHNKGLSTKVLSQRSINQLVTANQTQLLNLVRKLRSLLAGGPLSRARPRGVMWDMATDPSLAVTVFHLLERASVALPLSFMLMPVIQMMRSPQLNGLNFNRFLPAKASHRSVDYEELAKRLDVVDKILSRALRQTHREGFMGI